MMPILDIIERLINDPTCTVVRVPYDGPSSIDKMAAIDLPKKYSRRLESWLVSRVEVDIMTLHAMYEAQNE